MFTPLDIIFVLFLTALLLGCDFIIFKAKPARDSIIRSLLMSAGMFTIITYLSPVDIYDTLVYTAIVSCIYLVPSHLRNPQKPLDNLAVPLVQYIVLAIITFFWLF